MGQTETQQSKSAFVPSNDDVDETLSCHLLSVTIRLQPMGRFEQLRNLSAQYC